MTALFEATAMNGMPLGNRLVRSGGNRLKPGVIKKTGGSMQEVWTENIAIDR